jgi:enamine deaminase RidA (YjgF/YER057c/UK114 family)
VVRHCRVSKGETDECGSAIERTGPGAAGAAEASRQLSALPACGQPLFLAGQGPRDEKAAALTGKLGAEISIEEGYRRARLVGLGLLSAMRDALGSLDRVDFIVKLLGMVNAVPDFNDSPKVINGCSDLFVEVFGDAGRHARSAVGNAMLPNQISVEIEGIIAVKS